MQKSSAILRKDTRRGVPVSSSVSAILAKAKPGDIIITKPREKENSSLAKRIENWWTGSRWNHSGVYVGDGRIVHQYQGIRGGKFIGPPVGRLHHLTSLPKVGRDLLLIRPKRSRKERRQAAQFALSQIGTPYSLKALVRTIFAPAKKKKGAKVPDKYICNALTGFAYPKVNFGKSPKHLRAIDILKARGMKQIAAYSSEGKR